MKHIILLVLILGVTVPAASVEFTWTGNANDQEWSNPFNWNILPPVWYPDSDDDVIIPVRTGNNYPQIAGEYSYCASLTIETDAWLFINTNGKLTVNEDADIYGVLFMQAGSFMNNNLYVYGLLNWQSGSTAYTSPGSTIHCTGQMHFLAGSDVRLSSGVINFYSGLNDCYLVNNSPNTELSIVRAEMSASHELIISAAGTEDFTINGFIYNEPGSTISCNYGGSITLKQSLYDYNESGSDAGIFFEHGTLVMDGNRQFLNLYNPIDRLNNLVCSVSDSLIIPFGVTLLGDLTIESGVVSTRGNDITLAGDWTNSVGSTGFVQAGTTVTFNSIGNSYVYADENFDAVVLAKTGSGTLIIPSGSVLDCDSYDWESGALSVTGGLFYANDLVDDAILGSVTLSSGSIVLAQDPSQYLDLRGNLTINGGELHLWGGATDEDSYFPYGGDAGFTMTGGLLYRHGYGIVIFDTTYLLTSLVSGGTIKVDGSFRSYRSDYEPTGGTVELAGTADATLYKSSGTLWNLKVDKAASRSEETSEADITYTDRLGCQQTLTRSNRAFLSSDIILNGTLLVSSGLFDLNGWELHCAGNVDIYGTLKIDVSAVLFMGSSKTLSVRSGGRLEVLGSVDGFAKITHTAGYYALNVQAGATIAANFGIFEYIGTNGVYVYSNSHVDPANSFTWCIFRNGISNGSLLTVNNADPVVIANAIFPTNTWSGLYNVRKSVNAGQVYLINASGGFDGETYDNDNYERVHWDTAVTTPDFMILGAVWSPVIPSPYLGDTRTLTVTLFNNSSVAWSGNIWLDLYYDLDVPPAVEQEGQQYTAFTSLPALTAVQHTFTVANYDPAFTGTWNSYLFIDSFDDVDEADETNNIFGPFSITWRPLPVVPVSISYAGGTEALLSWTYPISADRFNIYVSSDPEGSFTTPGGWTTGNSYAVPMAMDHLYFRVKAQRTDPDRNADFRSIRLPRP